MNVENYCVFADVEYLMYFGVQPIFRPINFKCT